MTLLLYSVQLVTEGVIMTLGNKIVKRMKVLSLGACSTRHATYINFSLLQTGTSTCDEHVYATLKIFRSSGRSSFHFRQLVIEPLGSAVTPNSTVGASYMVSRYQLKGIVGKKTMFWIDWTILCRRLFLREKKRMFCSIKAPPPPYCTTCLQNSTGSPSSSKNSTLPSEIQKAVCGMDGYFMEFPIVYHWLFASRAYKEVFSKSSEMT